MDDSKSAPLQLLHLTYTDIRQLADPTSFSRGEGYHRRGMIQQSVRRGYTLSAICQGSSGGPYDVRVKLAPTQGHGVFAWRCTCPLGYLCKHVVALLLTWVATPEKFEIRQSIEEILAGHDRDQLIELIHKLIELEPTIEAAIERLMPALPIVVAPAQPGDAARVTVSIKDLKNRLHNALDNFDVDEEEDWYDDEWNDGVESELEKFISGEGRSVDLDIEFAEAVQTAEQYEDHGWLANASAMYQSVATIGIDRFDDAFESEGIYRQILSAGRGLVRCLERQSTLANADRLDATQRTQAIEALYEVWFFTGHGHWEADGFLSRASHSEIDELPGPDFTNTIKAALTDDERSQLDERWRSEAANTHAEEWRRRSAIEFGIALNGPDGLDETEVLALTTKAELWWDQAIYLFDHDRIDEATLVATRKLTEPIQALNFAKLLAKSGDDGPDRAIRFVDDRLWETEGKDPRRDVMYLSWLAETYAGSGRVDEAFDARRRIFKATPDFASYLQLRRIATEAGFSPDRWHPIRAMALKTFSERSDKPAEMQVYLDERNAKEALELLKRSQQTTSSGSSLGINPLWTHQEAVARLCEQEFPDEAIRIYRSLAETQIGYRNRTSYQQAVPHIAVIKELLTVNRRDQEWKALIRSLRDEHRTLRALLQELDLAGLR